MFDNVSGIDNIMKRCTSTIQYFAKIQYYGVVYFNLL